MSFISAKVINGRTRYYIEKSVRLPGGKVKKYSVYLKGYQRGRKYHDISEYKKILEEKARKGLAAAASSYYKNNAIFTADQISKLEEIRLDYKKIIKKFTQQQLQDVIDRFAVNFTYESNAIEGNSLTLKDVTMIIREGKIIKGKDLREIYETINTRKALSWIFHKTHPIDEKTILKLHEMLVRDTGVTIGYKKLPNFLIGRNLATTPPENVKSEMEKLLEEYKKTSALHPLQRATIFHGKFEKIHPFEDGNGRVGRLLINIMLMHEGYPPVIIRKTQRVKYFHTLEACDKGHPENLCRFILQKYKDTYEKFFKIYAKYLF